MFKTKTKYLMRSVSASALMLGVVLPITLSSLPASAIELGGGKTFFDEAPRLVRSATSNPGYGRSTYQFTIKVPENAGVPLKAVQISQQPNIEEVQFDLNDSRAFIGDSFAGGPSVSLADIGGNQLSKAGEAIVVFDQPVEPGDTVTVSLRARQNPRLAGIYQFGVTAFPIGENSPGLYLGSARIHFTSR